MNTAKFNLSRFQWILIGVLAVQIVLAIVVNLPRNTQASSGPLIEDFDSTAIVDILLENQTGTQIHMAKVNGLWVLPDAGDFPVMNDKVVELLGKIKNVRTNRLVTQTAASHEQLLVADDNFMNRIILADTGGKRTVLYLGSSGGAGSTHVRIAGSNQVYLTSDLATWEIAPTMNNWIDVSYVAITPDQVQSLTVQNANGTFNFAKNADDVWTYDGLGEGEELNIESLKTTISRFTSLRMTAPLGKTPDESMGLDQPGAIATFHIIDDAGSASTLEITIGEKTQGGTEYAAKASNSPYYVKIAALTAESLTEMDHLSLLVQEPTPTP